MANWPTHRLRQSERRHRLNAERRRRDYERRGVIPAKAKRKAKPATDAAEAFAPRR